MTASVHSNLIRPEVEEEAEEDTVVFCPLSSCFMINDFPRSTPATSYTSWEKFGMRRLLLLDTTYVLRFKMTIPGRIGHVRIDTDRYGESCMESVADLTDLGSLGGIFLVFDWPSLSREDLSTQYNWMKKHFHVSKLLRIIVLAPGR